MEHFDKKRLPLFDFAYLGDTGSLLTQLADKATHETWNYARTPNHKPFPVLFNFLTHTFNRLKEQGKILSTENYSCFNTGLVTDNQEEIFMLFKRGDRGLYFVEFCTESDNNLVRFSDLPERASYFTDPSELIFDTRKPLRIKVDHIITDDNNFQRFPEHLQKVPQHQLVNTFHGAINHAKKRVERNYKTAIPQFYKGKLQLLLPLCLTDSTKADLALTVYKEGDFYVGRTCLTLDMAINNARLIARPDDEWLKP